MTEIRLIKNNMSLFRPDFHAVKKSRPGHMTHVTIIHVLFTLFIVADAAITWNKSHSLQRTRLTGDYCNEAGFWTWFKHSLSVIQESKLVLSRLWQHLTATTHDWTCSIWPWSPTICGCQQDARIQTTWELLHPLTSLQFTHTSSSAPLKCAGWSVRQRGRNYVTLHVRHFCSHFKFHPMEGRIIYCPAVQSSCIEVVHSVSCWCPH